MSGSLAHSGTATRQHARAWSRQLAREAAFLDHSIDSASLSARDAAAIRRCAHDTHRRAREKLLDAGHPGRQS